MHWFENREGASQDLQAQEVSRPELSRLVLPWLEEGVTFCDLLAFQESLRTCLVAFVCQCPRRLAQVP